MKRALLSAVLAMAVLNAPALAGQDENSGSNWPLPRDMRPGAPPSPGAADCEKRPCLYLVNISNHLVTGFHYATGLDKNGQPVWSANQFPSNFDFYSRRWTAWYTPKAMGCRLDLKIVMMVRGKPVPESGSFDTCANPTLLFTIHDPDLPSGYVTVDPSRDGPVPAPPPKPAP